MDLAEIINCLLEHGFLNQEDEEKPFYIEKSEVDGFCIKADIYSSRYTLVIGQGDAEPIAWFEPYFSHWQLRDDMPRSVNLINEACLSELLKYWEGLR